MQPRLKVIVSLLHENNVLLMEIVDPNRDLKLYLPVGGGVEFGETLVDAARREVREELGIEVTPVPGGYSENFFEFNGVEAHEIVFHFFARLSNETKTRLPEHATESDGELYPVHWYSLDTLKTIQDFIVPVSVRQEIMRKLGT